MTPFETITQEARASRTVLIEAYESDGTVETREIEPYSLRPGAPGKSERLYGFCLKREAVRSWTVDNIVRAEPTGNEFAPRWPVEL
ncbi:WYL domain-containing protein [Aeromicrobium erythreum]|uniref:WYL domain-containing protein n=1 Tax=Aeromicrobium erythreum TaxID=2041 RepID=UPI003AA88980